MARGATSPDVLLLRSCPNICCVCHCLWTSWNWGSGYVQYIPYNIHMVLVVLMPYSMLVSCIYLPIFFRVASLTLGQSYDCPSVSEGTLKNIVKTYQFQTSTQQSIYHFLGCTTVWDNIQSGTKPNLVAKIWPPNLVTICAWLPRLVANVSSKFQHLVNTRLTVGSLALHYH